MSNDESFSNTRYVPKDYFLTETFVESLTESTTGQRFPEQRFLEDVDYDDATVGETLFNAHREQVYHSLREGLSVGQSSSSVSDRSVQPFVETCQELNTEQAQIRDSFGPTARANPSPTVRRKSGDTKLQTDYDRRSIQKLSEMIESQREELHRAQAEGLHRRDQQLLHEQCSSKTGIYVKIVRKSLKEMEEMKKFQSSTFDTIARTKISRGPGHYFGTYW